MATINISIPDNTQDWIQTQIQEGKYSSPSDYVCDLIRRDQETRQQQQAIAEGLKSGISNRSMDSILKEAKARLDINRLEQRRASLSPVILQRMTLIKLSRKDGHDRFH